MGTLWRRLIAAAALTVTVSLAGPASAAPPEGANANSSTESKSKVRTVDYRHGATVSRDYQVDEKFRRTNAKFRSFMERRIRYVTSHDCEELGQISVYRWRSDGWAVANEHYGCGGNQALYRRTAKGWRAPAALATQEAYRCRKLRNWKVPPALLHRAPPQRQPYECYNPKGRLVRYR